MIIRSTQPPYCQTDVLCSTYFHFTYYFVQQKACTPFVNGLKNNLGHLLAANVSGLNEVAA
jgi:hypothetical protein